jgi:hypothetical protein
LEIIKKVVPTPTNETKKEVIEKKGIKTQRVIMDAMKDHLIPHMAEKKSAKEMFKALDDFF